MEIDSCPHKSNLGSSVIVNCFDRSHWPELAAQWTRVLTTVTGPEDLRGRIEPRARPQLSASSHHTRAQHPPEPETFSRSGLGPECSAAPLSVQSLQFCYYATSLNRKIALLCIALPLRCNGDNTDKNLFPGVGGITLFIRRPGLGFLS